MILEIRPNSMAYPALLNPLSRHSIFAKRGKHLYQYLPKGISLRLLLMGFRRRRDELANEWMSNTHIHSIFILRISGAIITLIIF
jgi:hypothetical protein